MKGINSKIQNELPPSRPVPRDVEFYAGPRIADVLEHFQNLLPTPSLHGWWTDGQTYFSRFIVLSYTQKTHDLKITLRCTDTATENQLALRPRMRT
jgi:hypothetical protein